MKNSQISSIEIGIKIQKTVLKLSSRTLRQKTDKSSSHSSDLASIPIGVRFLSKRYKKLLGYLLLYHYYPLEETIACYIYLDLYDFIEENSESFWLIALMDNRETFLRYLEVQETMTEQQFFAGICNETFLEECLNSIVYRFEEKLRKPKRVIRRKGYRDKGTLPSFDERVRKEETSNDFFLKLYQLELEEKCNIQSSEISLLRSHLKEGRVLTDEYMIKFKLKKGVKNETERDSSAENYCKRREIRTSERETEKIRNRKIES